MITIEQIKAALFRSGYLLKSRVADYLSNHNYIVESNMTFQDPLTEKSREIDLLAQSYQSHFNWKLRFGNGTRLVIETINNSIPVVFSERML